MLLKEMMLSLPLVLNTQRSARASCSILATVLPDIYGFEDLKIPELPCGSTLKITQILHDGSLLELTSNAGSALGDVDDEAELMRRIRSFVSEHKSAIDTSLVGAQVWPAAAALCRWLRETQDEIRAKRVLEIGCGTGVCGLFAGALGASKVVLTDGGPSELERLVLCNIADNEHAMPDSLTSFSRMLWGDTAHPLLDSQWDLVLASDITYAHGSNRLIMTTFRELLSRSTKRPPPRIVLSHEHRERDRGLREQLDSWSIGDPVLADFAAAASEAGLALFPLRSERPQCTRRGLFCSWTPDLSIFELRIASNR